MELLIIIGWLALCGVAAYIADNKGRSGVGIFFLSLLLSPLIGIIVALALSPNIERVAIAQGKKKCPNCAEFVQPDARTCRFCQHRFVEEEAAERERRDVERLHLETENAKRLAAEAAAEAAKPWVQRYWGVLIILVLMAISLGGTIWSGRKHPDGGWLGEPLEEPSTGTTQSAVPAWAAQERSLFPKSVWDKRVGWAAQHHCYFGAMSRDEIVQTLGQPTEENSNDLTYKRPTRNCIRYDGDNCAEYKTEQRTVWLEGGYGIGGFYPAPENSYDQRCRTLYGEHQYLGFEVPTFALTKGAKKKTSQARSDDQTAAQ